MAEYAELVIVETELTIAPRETDVAVTLKDNQGRQLATSMSRAEVEQLYGQLGNWLAATAGE